jgi:hypothetical protein
VGRRQIEFEEVKQRAGEALCLAQGEMEDLAQQQATADGGIRVEEWPTTTNGCGGRKPLIKGRLIDPKGETSATSKGGVILRPVTDAVLSFGGFLFHTKRLPD